MISTGDDGFTADIPGQDLNTGIEYYMEFSDGENVVDVLIILNQVLGD